MIGGRVVGEDREETSEALTLFLDVRVAPDDRQTNRRRVVAGPDAAPRSK